MRWLALTLAAARLYATESVNTPIDNDQVKVLSVVVQPHEKTKLHQHKVSRVMVYLDTGRQDFSYPDGAQSVLMFKAGEVKWSPAGGMHIAEVTSGKPVRIIEVELKRPGTGAMTPTPLDPVKLDPKRYNVEVDNDQVRVTRVKIGPGERTLEHEHTMNRVVVFLSDQTNRITTSDGKTQTFQRKAGQVSWSTPVRHTEQNVGGVYELVMIQLKNYTRLIE